MSTRVRMRGSGAAAGGSSLAVGSRRGRLRRLRPLLVSLLLAAVLAGGAWVVLASSWLGVRTVAVDGTSVLDPAVVRATADVPQRQPLARLDVAGVTARVEEMAWVQSVRVDREWPQTVRLVVTERTPVANVRAADGGVELVDATGAVLEPLPEPRTGLPTVRVEAADPPRAQTAALRVVESLPSPLRQQVREVRALSPEDVQLSLADGRLVLWGSPDRAERKILVLQALLGQDAKVFDVSAPDAPTTR